MNSRIRILRGGTSNSFLKIAMIGLSSITVMAGDCGPSGPESPAIIPTPTGTVTGRVAVDGEGASGVIVRLQDGSSTIATATTGPGGTYAFSNVAIGAKNVSISTPPGATCSTTRQDITLDAGETATANFACTPLPGTVTGQVTVDGAGISGIVVTLLDGTTIIATTTTSLAGLYRFFSVPRGKKAVSITTPSRTTCEPSQQIVTLHAGGTATASFVCIHFPGIVTGRVTLDGAGMSGILVKLLEGPTTITTTTTGSGGAYEFSSVAVGGKTVSISAPPSAKCATNVMITVQPGEKTVVNFACTTLPGQPAPTPPALPPPGPSPPFTVSVSGQVTATGNRNGRIAITEVSGLTVMLIGSGEFSATTTTDERGFYRFARVTTWWVSVRIDPRSVRFPGTSLACSRYSQWTNLTTGDDLRFDFPCWFE